MVRRRVVVVVGTRPEAIKLAPVLAALRERRALEPLLVATSQHRELLRQALRPFALEPDIDLDVMAPEQTPCAVVAAVLTAMEGHLRRLRPAWVVVQGDTTSAFAAALAAFCAKVPVAHVEAGLRSGTLEAPFPEEFNRRALTLAAALHFAPTRLAGDRLVHEGVDPRAVRVVGNTVVDALQQILPHPPPRPADGPALVVLTLHRRESFGAPLVRMLDAVAELVRRRDGAVRVVYPVHPNPEVDGPARARLGDVTGVELLPPMDYPEFLALLARARLVLTDSGGVQEEAPSLGTPVVVLRDVTERPELVESGWGVLAGTDPGAILEHAAALLDDDGLLERLAGRPNPFGDGHAARRIAAALESESLC